MLVALPLSGCVLDGAGMLRPDGAASMDTSFRHRKTVAGWTSPGCAT